MGDILPIVAGQTVHDVQEALSLCDPNSYYFLSAMAELNGDKPRSLLDIIAQASVGPSNVGDHISKATPFDYYVIKGIQEYADSLFDFSKIPNLAIALESHVPNLFQSKAGALADTKLDLVGYIPPAFGTSIEAEQLVSANKMELVLPYAVSSQIVSRSLNLSPSITFDGEFTLYGVGYLGINASSLPMMGNEAGPHIFGFLTGNGAVLSRNFAEVVFGGTPANGQLVLVKADRDAAMNITVQITGSAVSAPVATTGDFVFNKIGGIVAAGANHSGSNDSRLLLGVKGRQIVTGTTEDIQIRDKIEERYGAIL